MKEDYHNLFIAKCDILYTSDRHFVNVPKGTVLVACGGGCFASLNPNDKIILANITAIDRRKVEMSYSIRKDPNRFIEIPNNVWAKTLLLTEKIEDFGRNNDRVLKCADEFNVPGILLVIRRKEFILDMINELIEKLK